MQIQRIIKTIIAPKAVRIRIFVLSVGVLLFSLSACSKGEVFFRYHQIGKGEWYRDSLLTYTMDSISFNPLQRYNLSIELTTADKYPYKDIWLKVEHNLDDSIFSIDTIHSLLADDYGRWLGSGAVGLHQISIPYKSTVALDTSMIYVLQISHLMSNNLLPGVEKVGLKVVEYSN